MFFRKTKHALQVVETQVLTQSGVVKDRMSELIVVVKTATKWLVAIFAVVIINLIVLTIAILIS